MSDPLSQMDDIEFNADDLWKEEVITDRTVGSIRVMTPVTADGEDDPNRSVEYYAQTQIMTQAGALPIEGKIDAETLRDAISKFGATAKDALQEMMERMREMQREQAQQIVTPDQAMGGMGGAPGGGQGGPGGFSLK